MEDFPADLKAFLLNHPYLQLTDKKRIKCTLNDHEFPCDLAELQRFTNGKKYEKLCSGTEFNYSQYEPHIVQSSKQPRQFFCKLTLRHLNRQPHHVLKHVNGKRFKKALAKYEECMKAGLEYVPARLLNKRPKNNNNNDGEPGPRRRESKKKGAVWEPSTDEDDEDGSDSEDSMSDLYPPTVFTPKSPEVAMEEDDFQTDDDEEEKDKDKEEKEKEEKEEEEEEEEGAMEVENTTVQKRKKAQGGGLNKKQKNNNWRRKNGKVQP